MAPWTPECKGVDEGRAVGDLLPRVGGDAVDEGADEVVERVLGDAVGEGVDEVVERVLGTCGGDLSTGESVKSLASSEECALNEFSNVHW